MSGHVTDEWKCLELRGQASRREQCTTASYPGYFTRLRSEGPKCASEAGFRGATRATAC
jgi:hypothetical protein